MTRPAELHDFGFLLYRNGLVLALHALACVAGFIAGSQLPTAAEDYSGVRAHAARPARARWRSRFVAAATLFSLGTQAYALGHGAASLSAQLGHLPARCCWSRCSRTRCPSCSRSSCRSRPGRSPARRGAWNELLAATFATTAVAIPLLVLAAAIETWVTPSLLAAASPASYTF